MAAETVDAQLDYLEHIRRESARFAACLANAEASARVPTCPDWTADDLLWHLTEVQLFWAVIVRDRLAEPDPAEAQKPAQPTDRAAALALFAQATTTLIDAVSVAPPETEVWTWAADRSVAFVRRRQAHEALIHRLDAESVIGAETAVDRDLASDGVDEVLTLIHGDLPEWATFTPDGTTGLIEAADTAAAWLVTLGRFGGTSPNTAAVYDMDTIVVDHGTGSKPAFTLRASAADLDAWLWGRAPVERLALEGRRDAFQRLEQIVSRGVQ